MNGHNGQVRDLLANDALLLREGIVRQFLDPRRDVYAECGYPKEVTDPRQYWYLYDREAVAGRVVECLSKESWQVTPQVYERHDATRTEFEQAWYDFAKQLRAEGSKYRDETGSAVWQLLLHLDILAGIGSYGVCYLALDDGLDPSQPAAGLREEGSVPAGWSPAFNAQGELEQRPLPAPDPARMGAYRLVRNRAEGRRPRLLFARALPEHLARVTRYEANFYSPRFGQPLEYLLMFGDPSEWHTGIGLLQISRRVHWTRVLHVTDTFHHTPVNVFLAVPRLKPVLNQVLGLQKLYCGAPEGYWKSGCMPTTVIKTNPNLGTDVTVDVPGTRDQLENVENSLQRHLILQGLEAQTLGPAALDPTPWIAGQIEAICIKLSIPKRVFMGSERGELASTQDDDAWNDRLRQRQQLFVTPGLVCPFVDRLVLLGVLPEPAQYTVEWPDLTSLSEGQRADLAGKVTDTMASYLMGGVDKLLAPRDFLLRVVGPAMSRSLDEQGVEQLLASTRAAARTPEVPPLADRATSLQIRSLLQLVQQASAGVLTEEQLREYMRIFLQLSPGQVDALLVGGLPRPPGPLPPLGGGGGTGGGGAPGGKP